MPLSEADTRAKLLDPALHARGWTEDLIKREETAGAIEVSDGGPRKAPRGRVDYTLRVKVTGESQPVALALIEAKAEHLPPMHGLEQGKLYADSKRFNVKFVFASNGHQYVEFDRFTGKTDGPFPLTEFPTPAVLRERYERGVGFTLASEPARPMLSRYLRGEGGRRYYQDAAIRAALEKLARWTARKRWSRACTRRSKRATQLGRIRCDQRPARRAAPGGVWGANRRWLALRGWRVPVIFVLLIRR